MIPIILHGSEFSLCNICDEPAEVEWQFSYCDRIYIVQVCGECFNEPGLQEIYQRDHEPLKYKTL